MVALAAGVLAPIAVYWHGTVVPALFCQWDPERPRTALAKAMLEQAVYAPVANTAFIVASAILDGQTSAAILNEWRTKITQVWGANVGFWGPLGLVNYKMVPPQFRFLFAKCFSLIWIMFLASRTAAPQLLPPPASSTGVAAAARK